MPEETNRILIAVGVLALFGIITFALAAATLGTVNKRMNTVEKKIDSLRDTGGETTTTTASTSSSYLVNSIRIEDLMYHLKQFEDFAKASGNTRAIGTTGFSQTIDYIQSQLNKNAPTFKIFREPVPVINFTIKGTPEFSWTINGVSKSLVYSASDPTADFTHVNYSKPIDTTNFTVALVPNQGCSESDWADVAGRAALVIAGGSCTYAEKGEFANAKNARALIYYNNGLKANSLAPVVVRLRQLNALPALYLSYAAGKALADVVNNSINPVTVTMHIEVEPYGSFFVDNICADTPEGLQNETILIGSHSDSVPAGPGINDNGSGSSANLVLVTNLARLYNTSSYPAYKYRVRFCWWAAEEIGLVGSIYHALNQTRNKEYLVNLNYDMLGSPNFFFGIYDGKPANPPTPDKVSNGSVRIAEAYRNWFIEQKLPWDYTEFSGRSDYGPFLKNGIVAGGLFSGADETKTAEQRNRYENQLGKGRGGLAGALTDPCYHQSCDTGENIDQGGYLRMAQAAAYMLEYLGRRENLLAWLYPNGR